MPIRPSKKHGLNPALVDCFFCGKEKSVAMLGKLKGDQKAPTHILMDYEPCTECAAKQAQGITFVEVTDTPGYIGMPEIHKNVWPTGRWCVCKESILDAFKEGPIVDQIRKRRVALIGKEMFDAIHTKAK